MVEDWQLYSRGPVPYYRIDLFESLWKASAAHNKKSFLRALYSRQEHITYWGWSREGLSEWKEMLLSRITDRNARERHYHEYESVLERSNRATEEVRIMNLRRLNDAELADALANLRREADAAQGMPNIDLDVFDIYYDEFFRSEVRKQIPGTETVSDSDFDEMIRVLSEPIHMTFVAEEEKMMLQAALGEDDPKTSAGVIHERFWWVPLGWEHDVPREKGYYEKKLEEYERGDRSALQSRLSDIEERPEKVGKQRMEIIRKMGFDDTIEDLLRVLDRFTALHDLRKEAQVRGVYAFLSILSEAVKRLGIENADKELYSREEIRSMLLGKPGPDAAEIERRRRAILILVERDGIRFFSGEEAERMIAEETEEEHGNVEEFSGIGASKGVVRARVKVCIGAQEALRKVKEGDILVIGMTTPDTVPAMKLASAVVTNEGGVTCHAAIVSRELNVPCVVGTHIATKVLKDGDMVEVDADRGVVRIIDSDQ